MASATTLAARCSVLGTESLSATSPNCGCFPHMQVGHCRSEEIRTPTGRLCKSWLRIFYSRRGRRIVRLFRARDHVVFSALLELDFDFLALTEFVQHGLVLDVERHVHRR